MIQLTLSNGIVHAHIHLEDDETLPSSVYPVLETLVEALETANTELDAIYEDAEDDE